MKSSTPPARRTISVSGGHNAEQYVCTREIRKPDQDKGSKDHDQHKCSLS